MKVLFDVSVLQYGVTAGSSRTGIFNVTRELLRRMVVRDDVEVVLMASDDSIDDVEKYINKSSEFNGLRVECFDRRIRVIRPLLRFLSRHRAERREEKPYKRFVRTCYRLVRDPLFRALDAISRRAHGKNDLVGILLSECDAYFSPAFAAPDYIRAAHLKVFVILYDLTPFLFPAFYPNYRSSWLCELVGQLRSSDVGFPISLCTLRDFERHVPCMTRENMQVIPLAASKRFSPCECASAIDQVREKYGIPAHAKYLLSLCNIAPHKNMAFSIRAFVKLAQSHEDLYFVVAGAQFKTFTEEIDAVIAGLGLMRHRVLFVGYVDDADVSALYSGAQAFVYLSQYEGFGLPPLEAMQCGCPVLTSNTSSLPEVVGDTGLMVAPDDLDGAVSAMTRLVEDDSLRAELRQKGLERCKLFSWDKTAEIIVDTMKKTLEMKG